MNIKSTNGLYSLVYAIVIGRCLALHFGVVTGMNLLLTLANDVYIGLRFLDGRQFIIAHCRRAVTFTIVVG